MVRGGKGDSLTRTRDELVNLFGIVRDRTRGPFGSDGIYPDMLAPVVRLGIKRHRSDVANVALPRGAVAAMVNKK